MPKWWKGKHWAILVCVLLLLVISLLLAYNLGRTDMNNQWTSLAKEGIYACEDQGQVARLRDCNGTITAMCFGTKPEIDICFNIEVPEK